MAQCTCKKNKNAEGSSCLMKILFVLTLLAAVFVGFDRVMPNFYVFDQNVLHTVAKRNIEKYSHDSRLMMQNVAKDLAKEYPGHIELKEEWVFNNAGGAMGSMWILHASISEYVIIFGTAVGTEGHTGRFFADDYFIMLEGEQWAYNAGDLTRQVYNVGEMHHLPRGAVQQYKIPEHGFALEYARGWIPLMLPFGFFDTIFSTLDFVSGYHTLRLTGKAVITELLQGKI
ncbi:C-8 sterol isomerase [Apophysomyces ossiformis]|uniref:C-8 sterol isomerase n=1 Tax=Apophysomyces ossiformis TaxID=679940 RepID=A0A8H7BS39_9FUNG|nr:C-8 sterol isomerase [Apophysomyces ossiformis]